MRHSPESNSRTFSRAAAISAACLTAIVAAPVAAADDPPSTPAAPAAPAPETTPAVDLPDTSGSLAKPAKAPVAPTDPTAPACPVEASTQTAPPAYAGAGPALAPDRPGFGDTTTITPVGHLQLEVGYTYTYRDRRGVESHTHNAPEVLARVGLIDDRLELRVSTSGYVWSRTDDGSGNGFDDISGLSDIAIGARLKICDQDGLIPRLAFGVSTTISMGDDEISNQEFEPTVRFIGSWNLGSNFSLTSNVGMTYASPADGRFVQGFGSMSLGYAVNDRLSVFFEYFVVGPRSKGTHAAHSIDFGGAYLLSKRVQIDARLGFGLNQEADNFFAGTGLSVLF